MLNDLLFSFFVGAPAVIAVILSRSLTVPAARALTFWGGLLAVLGAAAFVVPLLLCKGDLMTGYSACAGGQGLTDSFNAALPGAKLATMAYVLAGPPLAGLAWLVERLGKGARRA
jgi:hypothetical protein